MDNLSGIGEAMSPCVTRATRTRPKGKQQGGKGLPSREVCLADGALQVEPARIKASAFGVAMSCLLILPAGGALAGAVLALFTWNVWGVVYGLAGGFAALSTWALWVWWVLLSWKSEKASPVRPRPMRNG